MCMCVCVRMPVFVSIKAIYYIVFLAFELNVCVSDKTYASKFMLKMRVKKSYILRAICGLIWLLDLLFLRLDLAVAKIRIKRNLENKCLHAYFTIKIEYIPTQSLQDLSNDRIIRLYKKRNLYIYLRTSATLLTTSSLVHSFNFKNHKSK